MILSGKKSICSHFCRLFSGWMLALGFLFISLSAKAADPIPTSMWSFPIIWNVDEQVTWYFDLTGTNFTAGQDAYMWVWQPSEPDAGNWTNSSDFAKLKYEPTKGNMVWSFTLTPTKYFKKTVTDLANFDNYFWMLLKSKDGSTVTGAFNLMCPRVQVGTFKTSGAALQVFPANFGIDTPVSILVNTSKSYVNGVLGGLAGKDSIFFESGINNFLDAHFMFDPNNISTHAKTAMKKMATNVYKIDMIPYQYFGVSQSLSFDNLTFFLWSLDGSKGTADAAGKNYLIGNTNVPVVSYFPQKFCQYDILTITRSNNEKSATAVNYTITAGATSFSGTMTGSTASMSASINLMEKIGSLTGLTKLNLKINVVKGVNTIEVYNSDLPLVALTDLQ